MVVGDVTMGGGGVAGLTRNLGGGVAMRSTARLGGIPAGLVVTDCPLRRAPSRRPQETWGADLIVIDWQGGLPAW